MDKMDKIRLALTEDKIQRNLVRLRMIYMRISYLMSNTFDLETVEYYQTTMQQLNDVINSLKQALPHSGEA